MGDFDSVAPISHFFAFAAAHPDRPWLFWGEGWDWRWMSYAQAAADVTRLREALGGGEPTLELAPDARAPSAYLWDLARQLDTEALGGAALATLSATFAALVAPRSPALESLPKREIVTVGPVPARDHGPTASGERAALSWALSVGAALVFEPDPNLFSATAAWARPTVFAGSADQIRDFAQRVAHQGRRFSRLRRVVGLDGSLTVDDVAAWRTRGVRAENFIGDPA